MSPASSPKSSDAVLERLMRLHPKVIDLTLDRVERLLARLGHPEQQLPPVIHVAGTNGKGSVIAYMRAALEEAGYRVHVYTSPHLVRFHERIRLAGDLIDEDELIALLEECETVNDHEAITFFEITTVAAFLAFTRTPADIVLLETGLGGRLDATNVVAKPAITVITSISLDHQQFLGDTVAKIAAEKAGILKTGVTCVVANQIDEALTPIRERAEAVGASLLVGGVDWTVRPLSGGFAVRHAGEERYLPEPVLPGAHQVGNAALAAMALDHLEGFRVPGEAIARGLRQATWPARFQRLRRGPLVNSLPDGWDLWLDGGHNESAAAVIASEIARWRAAGDQRPLHLVFGTLNSRDPRAFFEPLKGATASLHAVTIPGEENAIPANDIAQAATSLGLSAVPADSVDNALELIVADNSGGGLILICGSLYLAGCILAENG